MSNKKNIDDNRKSIKKRLLTCRICIRKTLRIVIIKKDKNVMCV